MSTTLPARFSLDQPGRGGGAPMATWEQIVVDLPLVAATMRTYLDQVAVVLRSLMLLLLSSGGFEGLLRGEPVAVFVEESGVADVAAFDA